METEKKFKFNNEVLEGDVVVRFLPEDNRLEIDLPCGNPLTCNRIYVEKSEDGFSVYTHNNEFSAEF